MFSFYTQLRLQVVLAASVLILSLANGLAAQTISSKKDVPTVSRAYVDYLQALGMAKEGSSPEALRLLADSVRLQPENNPASALIFELLIEQRANTPLRLRGHTGKILYAGYSNDGSKIVTASDDHTARIWDARTGSPLTPPLQHDETVMSAAFSGDAKRLVTGSSEGHIRVWDAVSGKPLTAPLELHGSVLSVSFSHDGKLIAAGTDDGKLLTWDAVTGHPLSTVVSYHEEVYSVSFNNDGTQLLSASGDGRADLLNPRTGTRLVKPLRHRNVVSGAHFSSDGKSVLTNSGDGTAQIWDAKTGVPGVVFRHSVAIEAANFSSDGSRVVTASMDHTARVWDAKTGQPITPPMQHPASVERASFSPDGRLVATVAADNTIRLWDAGTGEMLHLPIRGKGKEFLAAFSPDGLSLLTVDGSTLELVDMPPVGAPPVWLVDLADFAATQNSYEQSRKPDLTKIHELRLQLLGSNADDSWTRFGKWYFADSGQRAVSPWSQISLETYVSLLIERGDRESLEYARFLAHEHPSWLAKISPLLAKLPPEQAPSHPKE